MATQYTEEFKVNAVKYWNDHPDLGIGICAKNLGIVKVLFLTGERPIHLMMARFPQEGEGILKAMKPRNWQDYVRSCVIPRMLLIY